jgi:hypothetical protein
MSAVLDEIETTNVETPARRSGPYKMKHPTKEWKSKLPCCASDPELCQHKDDHQKGITNHEYLGRPGSGSLEQKADGTLIYHTPWVTAAKPRPFKMDQLKPRNEKPAKVFARLKAEIEKTAVAAGCDSQRHIGHEYCRGWVIVATDGHRALLEKKTASNCTEEKPYASMKDYKVTMVSDPELQLTIKRALVAAPTSNLVMLECGEFGLVVKSGTINENRIGAINEKDMRGAHKDGTDFVMFDERLETGIYGDGFAEFGINGKYLESALGCWPVCISTKDPESAIAIEPESADWRLIVMPMRTN